MVEELQKSSSNESRRLNNSKERLIDLATIGYGLVFYALIYSCTLDSLPEERQCDVYHANAHVGKRCETFE